MPTFNLSDWIYQRSRDRKTDQNTQFQQLIQAANLGKDIWSQLQEQNKYKPGSDYYNFQKEFGYNLPLELSKQQGEQKLGFDKQWLDYQNQNPGKPAEQVLQEWYQTDAGKAALAAGYQREDAVRAAEHKDRMAEIAASRGANQNWMDVKDAHDLAISDAATAFHMPLDATGNPTWTPEVDKEKVRAMLHDYAQFVDPAQRQGFISLMDKWVDTGASTSVSTTGQTPPGTTVGSSDIVKLVANIQKNLALLKTGSRTAKSVTGGLLYNDLRKSVETLQADQTLSDAQARQVDAIAQQMPFVVPSVDTIVALAQEILAVMKPANAVQLTK